MRRLAALLYVIVAPTAMGVLATLALLIEGLDPAIGLTAAALIGAIAAVPASWLTAKALARPRSRP